MLQESILQYFRPSLSYHMSLRPLFCVLSVIEWPLKTGFTVHVPVNSVKEQIIKWLFHKVFMNLMNIKI